MVLDDGTKKKVLTALNAVKDRLGKDAMAKAARYNVSLSDDELLRFSPPAERIPTRSQRAEQIPQKVWTNPASLMRKRQPMQGRRMPRRMAVPIPAVSPLRAITDTNTRKQRRRHLSAALVFGYIVFAMISPHTVILSSVGIQSNLPKIRLIRGSMTSWHF